MLGNAPGSWELPAMRLTCSATVPHLFLVELLLICRSWNGRPIGLILHCLDPRKSGLLRTIFYQTVRKPVGYR
ncbi:hypothetical protein GYMLUDRAFT_399420 [Collybiopsis luxurians FD-317 M1]|nr:hypothetical protein GYMLUDRAFT_399420 [Collybiopsis luxurians FD-317 M1]